MIDSKLLTPEYGFQEGVVVEIIQDGRTFLSYWEIQNEEMMIILEVGHIQIDIDEIENIHPLTGPLAVWNYAPPYAQACRFMDEDNLNDTIFWYPKLCEYDRNILSRDPRVSFRPWWAEVQKVGE